MQCLSKKVITEQIELNSHLSQKSLKKKVDFNFNNDVFDVENIEVSDLNYQAERLSFIDQKYQEMKRIL